MVAFWRPKQGNFKEVMPRQLPWDKVQGIEVVAFDHELRLNLLKLQFHSI